MLHTVELTIQQVVDEVRTSYQETYGLLEPEVPNIACWAVRMALENIRRSDALYHDVEHTAMVTLVGLEILRGLHLREGGVTPHAWLQYVVALGCHDIGYVRGILPGDRPGNYQVAGDGTTVQVSDDGTDAALTPWHVDRGQIFVRNRFGGRPFLDADQICKNIELTRFPVPASGDYRGTKDFPALLRAADLIGQLSDPRYLQKLPKLFYEFFETGVHEKLGFPTPRSLRTNYPRFFWETVHPFIGDALDYLRATTKGQQWVANLHSQVFEVELEARVRD